MLYTYEGQIIGRGGAEEGGKVGVEGVEILHVDEEELWVLEEALPVTENAIRLESPDEFLEEAPDRVAGCRHCGRVGVVGSPIPEHRCLVAVVDRPFVPPRHR